MQNTNLTMAPQPVVKTPTFNTLSIAILCHEVNRHYCQLLGDTSQLPWPDSPEWQKQSAVKGVEFHLANPNATESASHESWLAQKRLDGWTYGPIKDSAKGTHPCFIPFSGLPVDQQVKDALFKGIVNATRRLVEQPKTFIDACAAQQDGIDAQNRERELDTRPRVTMKELDHMLVSNENSLLVVLPNGEIRAISEDDVIADKTLRRDIDAQIQTVKSLPPSRERSLAITKLQEAVMWLGMDLKRLNEPNPYPNSKDPSNTKIEPTADGLKL